MNDLHKGQEVGLITFSFYYEWFIIYSGLSDKKIMKYLLIELETVLRNHSRSSYDSVLGILSGIDRLIGEFSEFCLPKSFNCSQLHV